MVVLKFKSKPEHVEAVRISDANLCELLALSRANPDALVVYCATVGDSGSVTNQVASVGISNANGKTVGMPGDWLVRNPNGEFFPCKDAAFGERWEHAVEEGSA